MSDNERREYIVVYDCDGDTMFDMGTRERIVRCRDCKYSDAIKTRYQQETVYACLNFDSAAIEPDGFCAWGERREQ